MTSLPHAEVFAELLRALEPYLGDIVFVGGWVHALLLREADAAARPLRTTDVDVALPRALEAGDRPRLLDLIRAAGFSVEVIDRGTELVLIRRGSVDLDLLVEAENPREVVHIAGQEPLAVQGYSHLGMLLSSSRAIAVGEEVHRSLDPPLTIRIPTLAAYVIGKVVSAEARTSDRRRAKDLVYLYQVLANATLANRLTVELPGYVGAYPAAARTAAGALGRLLARTPLLRDVSSQLIESGVAADDDEPLPDFLARLRRFAAQLERQLDERPADRAR